MEHEYSQQQVDAFKEVTHRGTISGVMVRVKDDSSLVDFLWQNQGYWQRSNVTKEIVLAPNSTFEEWSYTEEKKDGE